MAQTNPTTHQARMSRAEAARKGGLAVSSNREHMAKIGEKGGAARRHRHTA